MSTIHKIGSDPGDDYATPQAWYDDLKGNITNDPNAPYIGELRGEVHTGFLIMDGSTTDATHYFHLRPMNGAEFNGDFGDIAGVPSLNTTTDPEFPPSGIYCAIYIADDYTKLEHFLVANVSAIVGTAIYTIWIKNCSNVTLDSMGVYDIYNVVNYNGFLRISGVGIGNATNFVMKNCAIGKIHCDNTKEDKSSVAYGIYGYEFPEIFLYNNSIERIEAEADLTEFSYGIYIESDVGINSYICNNAIGTLIRTTASGAGETLCFRIPNEGDLIFNDYNASSDETAYGNHSLHNIVPVDNFNDITLVNMDLRIKNGSDFIGSGYNPYTFPSPPTEDIENDMIVGPWSIGCDWRLCFGRDIQGFARQATVGQAIIKLKEDISV